MCNRDAQTGAIRHPQCQRAIAGALDELDQRRHLIGQRQPEALLGRAAALNIIGGGRDHLDRHKRGDHDQRHPPDEAKPAHDQTSLTSPANR